MPASSEPQRQPDEALASAEERAWVESARHGDRQAFASLVQAYGGLVYRVIGRLVWDPDDRDDLVQETFYRACKGLEQFRPGAAFRPWLLTIALNAARDHLRTGQRWRSVSLDDADRDGEGGWELEASGPAADELAHAAELQGRVEAAFKQLDETAQVILWLRVREELSYAEIASVLGVAVGTVMSRLSRARQALRERLPATKVAERSAASKRRRS